MISQLQTSTKQRDPTGDQLLAEEKWIVETLKKIRNQRNCLQIERLHLESLKCKLANKADNISEVDITMDELKEPAVSSNKQTQQPILTLDEEILCNEEELNLSVMSPMFDMKQPSTSNMEEEEDDDEDEFNCDDLPIDMNMFMNGRKGT